MATTPNSIITVQTPKNGKFNWLNANGTTQETVYTAGSNGSKIISIIATQDSPTILTFNLFIVNGGTDYLLGFVTVPADAGSSIVIPAVNVLQAAQFPGLPVDSDGNVFLFLVSGDTIQAQLQTAVASPYQANIIAFGGDF